MHELNDDNFNEQIQNQGFVLVYFSATWCGPCKVYAPIFEEASKVITDAKFFKVDVDNCPKASMELSITAVPTTVIFQNGKKVHVLTGVKQVQDLVDALDAHKG